MNKLFKPQIIDAVLGNAQEHGVSYTRTPLNIEFSYEYVEPNTISRLEARRPDMFNAVGSLCVESALHHLPVIDVDRSFFIDTRNRTTKVIMGASEGEYRPQDSWLHEIMADYGIVTEIREGIRDDAYRGVVQQVEQVILRAPVGVLEGVRSTSPGHGHVYINRPFGESDYRAVLSELNTMGVVSREWLSVVEKSEMGVVRTPWTPKLLGRHFDS